MGWLSEGGELAGGRLVRVMLRGMDGSVRCR